MGSEELLHNKIVQNDSKHCYLGILCSMIVSSCFVSSNPLVINFSTGSQAPDLGNPASWYETRKYVCFTPSGRIVRPTCAFDDRSVQPRESSGVGQRQESGIT